MKQWHNELKEGEGLDGFLAARSELLSVASFGGESTARTACLRGGFRSGAKVAGQYRGCRSRSEFAVLFEHYRHCRGHPCRRRIPPFRLERVLVLSVSQCAASPYRAALSGRSRVAFFAHLHSRHQTRSPPPADRKGDRAAGNRRKHRLHAAAHGPLRTERQLCTR